MEEILPIDQPQRFGNKAFTKWWERVKEVFISSGVFLGEWEDAGGGCPMCSAIREGTYSLTCTTPSPEDTLASFDVING